MSTPDHMMTMDDAGPDDLNSAAMAGDDTKSLKAAENAESRLVSAASAALSAELTKPLAPGLYLVSTPIGNLADMSLRALATLARADMIFCEDTRHSRKLLSRFGISTETHAYHEHNAEKERPRIVARIGAGQAVALIADAGTPLVSDPGNKLVRALRDEGLPVFAVPGASAVLAALTSSGLPTDSFCFEGFLPPKSAARRKRLEALKDIPATMIFYEAPQRLAAMLEDLAEVFEDRDGVVTKELTKLHEGHIHGTLGELVNRALEALSAKGEFVVLAAPPRPVEVSDAEIVSRLKVAMEAQSFRDAVKETTDMLGVSRKRVYDLALCLKGGEGP
ncbi:MAG: 16S rRNA (cytidine(1402)-2'-O)-methyltransferase [Hyphomicrobiaceae bacterium]|nr:16S rRNA (cytidine(1402)-2'-O)-methyltransferase [Hyphomicrobiaceae bacterium]